MSDFGGSFDCSVGRVAGGEAEDACGEDAEDVGFDAPPPSSLIDTMRSLRSLSVWVLNFRRLPLPVPLLKLRNRLAGGLEMFGFVDVEEAADVGREGDMLRLSSKACCWSC